MGEKCSYLSEEERVGGSWETEIAEMSWISDILHIPRKIAIGGGEEGSEPGFQLRWVGVERETREGEFEMLSSEYLRSAEYDGFPEEDMRDFTYMSYPLLQILFI